MTSKEREGLDPKLRELVEIWGVSTVLGFLEQGEAISLFTSDFRLFRPMTEAGAIVCRGSAFGFPVYVRTEIGETWAETLKKKKAESDRALEAVFSPDNAKAAEFFRRYNAGESVESILSPLTFHRPAPPDSVPLTPEQFAAAMQDAAAISDPEAAHSVADRLLCHLLESLGYGEGVAIFDKITKWYS